MRMGHIFVVPFTALKYFPHYLINCTILEKEFIEIQPVFFIFSSNFIRKFIILRGTERNISIGLHVKYRLFLSDINGA